MRADAVRNRERILRVTVDLVLEYGPAVPMEVIARRAEVGVATLYRHFPDRASLFTQVKLDVMERAAEEAEAALHEETDAFAALARYMHKAIDLRASAVVPMLREHAQRDENVIAARMRGRAAVDALVSRAHREHALRPEVSTADISMLIIRLSRPIQGIPAADNLGLSHRHLELLLDGFLHFLSGDPLPDPAITLDEPAPVPDSL
ncbi:TetR/AcrR family transcriptional regulator [Actinophytocola sp.]|uniref:TetR/AcrR family transcriptional regulator n=1 Tax=Actinophytocola sp. TaxID=1872138 RepID=UPI003D6B27DE